VGQNIEVLYKGKIIDHGYVQAATYDGLIIWLAQNGLIERGMVERHQARVYKSERSKRLKEHLTSLRGVKCSPADAGLLRRRGCWQSTGPVGI
jgi:hypothetical protein